MQKLLIKNYKVCIFFILFISVLSNYAQNTSVNLSTHQAINNSKIDSLKSLLNSAKTDTLKIQLLIQIGAIYNFSKESLPYYEKALKLTQEINNTSSTPSRFKKLEASIYTDIGHVHDALSNYPKALRNCLKALRIYETLGMENGKIYANSLNNIGGLYQRQGEYDKALEYLLKSLKIKDSIGMEKSHEYGNTLHNIGNIFMFKGDYNQALVYYKRSLKIDESFGMEKSKEYAGGLNNIASVYYEQNNIDSTLYYDILSLKIREEIGDKPGIAMSYNNIGETYAELGKNDLAIDYLLKGLSVAKEIGDKYETMHAGEILSKAYAKLKNYKDGYRFRKEFTAYKDSIFNDEKSKEIGALEARYELDRQKEIAEREEKKRKQLEQVAIKRSNLIQLSVSFLSIIVFIFLVIRLVKLRLPLKWAERLLFFAFMMFFELTLLILEPQILQIAKDKILVIFFINSLVACVFFPLHKKMESKINQYLAKFDNSKIKNQHTTIKNKLTLYIFYLIFAGLPLLMGNSVLIRESISNPINSSKIDSLKSVLAITKEEHDKVNLFLLIGMAYKSTKESLPYFQNALTLARKIKNLKLEAYCYNNIGVVYQNLSNYSEELKCYLKALKIYETLGMENTNQYAGCLSNTGVVYQSIGEYKKAMDYHNRSLKIKKALGLEKSKDYALSMNNIGIIHSEQGEYNLALDYYLKCLDIYKYLGMENTQDYAMSLNNIGSVYYYINKKDSSLFFDLWSLKIRENIEDKSGIVTSLNNIGETYSEIGKYDTAIDYLKRGLDLAKIMENKHEIMHATEILAKTYHTLNKFKIAYEYLQLFSTYKDSIFNAEKSKEIGAIEEKYEWEKKELQMKFKEEEQAKILVAQKKRSDMISVSAMFISIVIFIFGILLYVSKFSFNIHFTEGLVFVVFLMFFELVMVFLNPYVELFTGNIAFLKLFVNSMIAATLSPLHYWLESKMKLKIQSDKYPVVTRNP